MSNCVQVAAECAHTKHKYRTHRAWQTCPQSRRDGCGHHCGHWAGAGVCHWCRKGFLDGNLLGSTAMTNLTGVPYRSLDRWQGVYELDLEVEARRSPGSGYYRLYHESMVPQVRFLRELSKLVPPAALRGALQQSFKELSSYVYDLGTFNPTMRYLYVEASDYMLWDVLPSDSDCLPGWVIRVDNLFQADSEWNFKPPVHREGR